RHTRSKRDWSSDVCSSDLAQVAPASVWRHQAEAEAYESQGSNDAAISEYHQVLSADARRPGIHYRLGRTLLARSRQGNAPDDVEIGRASCREGVKIWVAGE